MAKSKSNDDQKIEVKSAISPEPKQKFVKSKRSLNDKNQGVKSDQKKTLKNNSNKSKKGVVIDKPKLNDKGQESTDGCNDDIDDWMRVIT